MRAGRPGAAVVGILMAPLLLAQGLWVRRVTPKLPEAQGPREGVRTPDIAAEAGSSDSALRLLIVGDSSAAGVGATHQDEALAGRLSRALVAALATEVHWRLVARTGVTARATSRRCTGFPRCRSRCAGSSARARSRWTRRSRAGHGASPTHCTSRSPT